jgi:transcriptional regulator with GAF, ATPase, and Fis domain
MDSYPSLAQATADEVEYAPLTPSDREIPGILVPALAALHASTFSMEEMAQRDLQVSLQLLAQRMQYITGASAATIALSEGKDILCRASAGPMATELEAPLRANPALITECIRQQQIICCNAAENGISADGTSYGTLGIKSLMVLPLIREAKVIGILELLSDRPQAFDDRDGTALEHLSEIVLTALERSDAAKWALANIANDDLLSSEKPALPSEESSPSVVGVSSVPSAAAKRVEKVHRCEACGFPVSEGRTLCVDCENARAAEESSGTAPAFLSQLVREQEQGWLQAHFYTIGTLLMVALTVVALMLKLR